VTVKEAVFREVFRAGGIRSVAVVYQGARVFVRYVTADGVEGVLHSKRGPVKLYVVETALRWLRGVGVAMVTVDLRGMSADRGLLE
jgi:hypothetical protein